MPRWTQNCGVRRLPLDFRDQYFGCEIELTGINRATAAQTLADLFGTRAEHSGGGYDAYRVKDLDGKEWKIVRDGSIHPECRRRSVLIGETYKVELNSPKLEYGEMEKLQEVVRSLRRAGGIVNDSCGMHVHVDASKHTPQSLKNVLSIMYSKEDILFAALKVNPARIDSYCQAVDEPILEEIRKLPSGASMDQLKDRWYQGRDGSDYHYHSSRYRACNMHSVFYHGTIEWRLFNSTLHAGEAKANIILAKCAQPKQAEPKREKPVQENPAQLNTKEINKEETNNVSNPIRAAGQRTEYRALLLKNIEYPILAQNNPMDTMRLDELVELMLDVVCSKRAAIRISGEEMPAEVVKSRFLKLGAEHIQYVLDCLKDNPPRIRNIKQYLLAALYNAPLTIENYYAAQIDHDLCGGKR